MYITLLYDKGKPATENAFLRSNGMGNALQAPPPPSSYLEKNLKTFEEG